MNSMPNNVRRRIMQRCAQEDAIVVVSRGGLPSRVFGFNEYLKMREHAAKIKPWLHKQQRETRRADPLGASGGKVLSSLRREDIYG